MSNHWHARVAQSFLRCAGVALLLACGVLSSCSKNEPAAMKAVDGVAATAVARAERSHTLHSQLVGESDLPPEGTRSLLDYWLVEQGAIPYPFPRFLEALSAEDARGRQPIAVMVPDGRSLLKAQADFAAPRVIIAANMQSPKGALLGPDFEGRIYLGFTESAAEIELLSYNAGAGRFEFQLITDYCEGCNPRLVYAKRAICTTCHQSGVPIFSVRPWEETNAQPTIAARIATHHGDFYQGAATRIGLDRPDALDNLTNQSAVLVATQRAWLDGCGPGREGAICRRQMLTEGLRWLFDPAALAGAHEREQVREHWPEGGIPIAGNDLLSRNPFDSGLYQASVWSQIKRLVLGEPERISSGDRLADFDQLPKLPSQFDPLVLRPAKGYLTKAEPDAALGVALLFTESDKQRIEEAAGFSAEKIRIAIEALPDALYEAMPLQRLPFVQAMLQQFGVAVPAHRFDDLGELSEPILDGEPPLEIASGSKLEPFERYCFGCHRGNPSARLNFMGGATEAEVLEKIRRTDAIRDALDWDRYLGTRKEGQLMPPADSWQRAELVEVLEKGSPDGDPLMAMRDEVPALFDF